MNFFVDHFGIVAFAILALFATLQIRARKKSQIKAAKKIQQAVKTKMDEPLTMHPEIDPALCAGCGACTSVCPEGDILKLVNHKAVLVTPTKCVGHGDCERACPFNAITLVFGTKTRGMEIPRVTTNYETNVPGLYIAGELGGMGLIRNAIKQGVAAAEHALAHLDNSTEPTDTDLLIVGGGPAGLAASLVATSRQKKYICIEQNSFGGAVANFPRQKVVMSHPADLPIVGQMKFPTHKVSKEELLAYWQSVRRKTNLQIRENVKFETLEKTGNTFNVTTSTGKIRAKKVILALGVRGTPRRLGLANEDLPKVTYNLIDPEQYQRQQIAVVGGGNAGVEAAQYLAKEKYKNKVVLLVRGQAFDRCNEENQRIIFEMQKKGLVEIWFNSSVKEIHKESLVINSNNHEKTLKNDFLFVFAGADMPFKFLMSLGVQIDKKFGEAARRV